LHKGIRPFDFRRLPRFRFYASGKHDEEAALDLAQPGGTPSERRVRGTMSQEFPELLPRSHFSR
jgi:hypothetical protein